MLGPGLGLGLRHGPRPSMPKCRQGGYQSRDRWSEHSHWCGYGDCDGPQLPLPMAPPVSVARLLLLLLLCLPPSRPTSLGLWCDCCPPEGTRSLALQKSHHGVLGVTPLVVAVATRTSEASIRAVWRQDTWKLGAPGSGPCQGPRLVLGLVLGLGLGLGLRLGPRPGMPKCRQGNISLEVAGATTATGAREPGKIHQTIHKKKHTLVGG